jgi:hypothetical protein
MFTVKRDKALPTIVLVSLIGIGLATGFLDHIAHNALPLGHVALAGTLAALHFIWPYLAVGFFIMFLDCAYTTFLGFRNVVHTAEPFSHVSGL